MAWRISSPYQALQLVDITLPSVFFECLFLVSQPKHFFLHDHYSYHKFLFLFSYIPPLYSQVLDIQQVFPFVVFFHQMLILLLPEYWLMENHICQSPQ